MDCRWLPELIPCNNWADYPTYERQLYSIFKQDFVDSRPLFEEKPVTIRREPRINGYEQAFFHLTSKSYTNCEERCPDPRRCERIRWIRAFIENYQCDPNLCTDCDGVKVWREPYDSNRIRIHLLLEEEKYLVILEQRETYILLITAYYLDYPHSLEKQIKRYKRFRTSP